MKHTAGTKRNAAEVSLPERLKTLEAAQHRKMAQSAHRYVRGSTVKFYEWLQKTEARTLPDGPPVWICGDCHIGNLGPVANNEGRVEIEIRDVDQTVIGNPAHDLIRLALSLASAARGNDLPGVTTAHMMERMMEGYGQALQRPVATSTDNADGAGLLPIQRSLRVAGKRTWKHLAKERIGDAEPTIPLGRCFWALDARERTALNELFASDAMHAMLQKLAGDRPARKVKVVDAAYWMKGCSSLGKLRFAVIVKVGKGGEREYRLVDIKEATKAAAPAVPRAKRNAGRDAKGEAAPLDYAERVVAGARALSPYLGERMMAATLLGRPVVVRELMPQDLKLDMERLTREEAVAVAGFLAAVVGKAHARQMDAATRARWLKELERHRSQSLAAPGWLWRSVVELVAEHEKAYLEHCRLYAARA